VTELIGKTLNNGNYEVREIIGKGGMAIVYLGYQKNVNRQVAIKVLSAQASMDEQFKVRFEQEAITIARLQHPHILPLYDYGAEEDMLYLVMAYLSGGTLEKRIAHGEITLSEIERILREIGGAIDYAHRQGIIHRDIKPANILFDSEGHALLADFGIAKLAEQNISLTNTNVVGTPAYMSPEQAQGLEVTKATDIYSLGVVAFQAITGKLPFDAPSVLQLMLQVVQEPVPNLEDFVENVSPQLNSVLSRAMAKDPDARYATAQEFADAFSDAIHATTKTPILNEPVKRLENVVRTTKLTSIPTKLKSDTNPNTQTVIVQQSTNPLVLLGGFAIIAVALVALVVILMSNNPTNTIDVTIGSEATARPTDVGRVIPQRPFVPTFGRLSYTTTNAPGDTANLRVDNMQVGGEGVLVAWLMNTAVDTPTIKLGQLRLDALGSATLSYTDETGVLLPSQYNALIITREPDGNTTQPSDDVRYSAQLPNSTLQLITELLISSPSGVRNGSLLAGIQLEARIAAQHAGLAANAQTAVNMHIHAEHTINILRGEFEDYDKNGTRENPGRGIGIYTFADKIQALLDMVIMDEHSTNSFITNAEFIRVCLQNTRQRADNMVQLELALLASDDVEPVNPQAQESSRIANELQNGVDLNENGDIEGFEGECGLKQIDIYALLLGTLDIVEGGLK
jgi:serine/threonine protein kinase